MIVASQKKCFTQHIGKGTIYLCSGYDNERPNWHYVRVDSLKLPLFLRQSKTGTIDVADYGEVLFSGWGKEPPEEIRKKVKALSNASGSN